jgi:hypothetical protein
MSNPTDAELSRVIAESIEPKPRVRPAPPAHPLMGAPCSPLGAWVYRFSFEMVTDTNYRCTTVDAGEWRPAEFFKHPAMTLLLWERMCEKYAILAVAMIEGRIRRLLEDGLPTREAIQRGTAEAYAIAHNLIQAAR